MNAMMKNTKPLMMSVDPTWKRISRIMPVMIRAGGRERGGGGRGEGRERERKREGERECMNSGRET
jgi:hypothetical protein